MKLKKGFLTTNFLLVTSYVPFACGWLHLVLDDFGKLDIVKGRGDQEKGPPPENR